MIEFNLNSPSERREVKAVGLISGGLDSTLAAKIMHDMEIEVYGVYFAMPWGCCDKAKAMEAAQKIGINFVVLQLDEQYLEMVRSPKHGRGSALNPCTDCRIHMFSRAGQYMKSIGADFVFTGEVVGQRPMSQMKHRMAVIERETGLTDRLLRPLCAQLLEPTYPERVGLVNREKLLAINGRSRKEQINLAEKFGIKDYPAPAGGCLLTDKNFSRRIEDIFKYGYRNFRETIALKWGRHFRLSNEFKMILGRDESENESLHRYAHPDDYILELTDKRGPTLILKGQNPSDHILSICAGLIQKYSRYHDQDPIEVECWPVNSKNNLRLVRAQCLNDEYIATIKI